MAFPYPFSGEEFRQARERAGLSRVQLAAASHTFVYEIMKLEQGGRIPPNKYPKVLQNLKAYLPIRENY